MDIELRWKTKSDVTVEPIGGLMREITQSHEVLEFRYRCSMGLDAASEWQEVPHVGINED